MKHIFIWIAKSVRLLHLAEVITYMFISYRKLSHYILISFLTMILFALSYSIFRVPLIEESYVFAGSSIVSTYKSIFTDTNGNGKKDTINISIDKYKKEYIAEVINDDGKKYYLSPHSKLQSIGPYVSWCPLQITIADINMDRIPEIIMQIPKVGQPASFYIFRWNKDRYSNVLSGEWSGIYLMDVNGDRVPEIVTEGKCDGSGLILTVYSWIVKSYNKISIKLDNISRGYDRIEALMKLLSSPFDGKIPSDRFLNLYFTDDWIKKPHNLQYLNNFSRDIVGLQLQDYVGEETANEITRWKLRYIVFRKFDTEIRVENYTVDVITQKTGGSDNSYKIKDIKFKGH